jgi:hypothetical protein
MAETLEWRSGPREIGSSLAAIIAVDSISGPFTSSGGIEISDDDIMINFGDFVKSTPSDVDEDGAYDLGAAGVADLQRSVPVTKQLEAYKDRGLPADMIPDRTVVFYRATGASLTHFTRSFPVDVEALKRNTDRYLEKVRQAEEQPTPTPTVTTTKVETKSTDPKDEVKKPVHTINAPTGSSESDTLGPRKNK